MDGRLLGHVNLLGLRYCIFSRDPTYRCCDGCFQAFIKSMGLLLGSCLPLNFHLYLFNVDTCTANICWFASSDRP